MCGDFAHAVALFCCSSCRATAAGRGGITFLVAARSCGKPVVIVLTHTRWKVIVKFGGRNLKIPARPILLALASVGKSARGAEKAGQLLLKFAQRAAHLQLPKHAIEGGNYGR